MGKISQNFLIDLSIFPFSLKSSFLRTEYFKDQRSDLTKWWCAIYDRQKSSFTLSRNLSLPITLSLSLLPLPQDFLWLHHSSSCHGMVTSAVGVNTQRQTRWKLIAAPGYDCWLELLVTWYMIECPEKEVSHISIMFSTLPPFFFLTFSLLILSFSLLCSFLVLCCNQCVDLDTICWGLITLDRCVLPGDEMTHPEMSSLHPDSK